MAAGKINIMKVTISIARIKKGTTETKRKARRKYINARHLFVDLVNTCRNEHPKCKQSNYIFLLEFAEKGENCLQ